MNNLFFDNIDLISVGKSYINIISITIAFVGLTYVGVNSYINYHYINAARQLDAARQIEAARVQEGLPTEVTLTPEDFINNPELAEIFGEAPFDDENLGIILESNEQSEILENINVDAINNIENLRMAAMNNLENLINAAIHFVENLIMEYNFLIEGFIHYFNLITSYF
jgi:hypothetical protein